MTFGTPDRSSGCGCILVATLVVFSLGLVAIGALLSLLQIILPLAFLAYALNLCFRKAEDPLGHLTLDMEERRVTMLYKGEATPLVVGKRPLRLKTGRKLIGDGR